jgi:hypothetical protein
MNQSSLCIEGSEATRNQRDPEQSHRNRDDDESGGLVNGVWSKNDV